jgi:cytidyltransferase-like protein
MSGVLVCGAFDDLRSRDVRFLHAASRLGELTVLLWSDAVFASREGRPPKFPQEERRYLLESLRYINRIQVMDSHFEPGSFPASEDIDGNGWVVGEDDADPSQQQWCLTRGMRYHVLGAADLAGWPLVETPCAPASTMRPKVIVTGCYDWFHSGHARFFEAAAQLGDLYVAVGHDANIRYLKGEGRPMFPQEERRYMVHSVRWVKGTFITSGESWLDAAPEIERLKPEIYAVNEDGDVPEKREFCLQHELRYVVLKRTPKEGLPRRESTALRGF